MELIFVIILSYSIGSIPNGLIFGKAICGIDLREHGSKNIGATNAYRILGKGPAAIIFFADLLKGILGVWLGSILLGTPLAMIIGGVMAIIGHSWSLFLKFSGGKGVATGLGVLCMLIPKGTIIIFAVWCVIVYFTKYVSLASIVAAALVPVCMYVFNGTVAYLVFGTLVAAFVIYRHKTNIERLLNGTESKIKAGHTDRK